jgi:hypothetical protein
LDRDCGLSIGEEVMQGQTHSEEVFIYGEVLEEDRVELVKGGP